MRKQKYDPHTLKIHILGIPTYQQQKPYRSKYERRKMAPTKTEIETLCSHLATSDPSPFFDRVSPDVVWDVMGTIKQPSRSPILPAPHLHMVQQRREKNPEHDSSE